MHTQTDITGDEKKKRLKSEIRFARDSSTTLPKVDPLFRVQVTLPNKKRRDKTAEEFGEALVAYLGKKSDVINLEYETFKSIPSENVFNVNKDMVTMKDMVVWLILLVEKYSAGKMPGTPASPGCQVPCRPVYCAYFCN